MFEQARRFKLGRMEFLFYRRLPSTECNCRYSNRCHHYDGPFIDYVSWCYPSETIYFWRWELNIQNRRDPAQMYSKK